MESSLRRSQYPRPFNCDHFAKRAFRAKKALPLKNRRQGNALLAFTYLYP
jgi:hypothetical protein